ncbi:MAG TPA: hypothetical protein VFW71_01745 [Actinomycetota bacterium]|nr:hypothetical protein [Actinomycetota bacterium]
MQGTTFARVQFTNGRGERLSGVLATPAGGAQACALLPPALGHQPVQGSLLSDPLTRRGVAALQFNSAPHPSREGTQADTDETGLTLTSAAADVLAGIDAAGDLGWDPDRVVVVAQGLAARAAIRALALPIPVAGLVLVQPLVDVRPSADGPFALDALDALWLGVHATRKELGGVLAPVAAIAARRDPMVDAADVSAALTGWSPWPRGLQMVDSLEDLVNQPAALAEVLGLVAGAVEEALGLPSGQRVA